MSETTRLRTNLILSNPQTLDWNPERTCGRALVDTGLCGRVVEETQLLVGDVDPIDKTRAGSRLGGRLRVDRRLIFGGYVDPDGKDPPILEKPGLVKGRSWKVIGMRRGRRCGRFLGGTVVLACLTLPPGTDARAQHPIGSWEIAGPFPAAEVISDTYPQAQLSQTDWQEMAADSSGLIDLASVISRESTGPVMALVRIAFNARANQTIELSFGFAEQIVVFFNGEGWFLGRNSGDPRTPTFRGDHRGLLETREGRNEILMVVRSGSGPWAFSASTDIPLLLLPPGS